MAMNLFFWITLAIISATVTRLMHRYVVKDASPYAYSWLTQVIGTLLFIPLMLPYFALPSSSKAWWVLIGASALWVLVDVSALTAFKKTEVSLKEPLSQSKLIWTLFLGAILLGEAITAQKVIGTLVIFLGVSVLIWHPERKWGRLTDPGVLWTLLTAVLSAGVAIVDKFALGFFTPELYGFLVYLFPGIILSGFLRGRTASVKHLMKTRGWSAVIAVILSTATYYFGIKAYALADVSYTHFCKSESLLPCLQASSF